MSELRVPFLDLRRQYAGIRKEIDEAIRRVVESQRFVLGPEVETLEEEVASYCETRFAVGCASGSDAILLALMAHGVGPGDQVICPGYSFFSTAGSISRLGAAPVFADIEARTFNVNGRTLRAAAERCTRLKAIIPVHLYGRAAPMGEILALGEELGVPIIEDTAQAIGARDTDGSRVGSRSGAGCFSFYPSKNLGGYGDGGMVTTGHEGLAERIRSLREHGAKPKHYHPLVGLCSRLDALQAAVLRAKLAHLDAWIARRRANAAIYNELLGDTAFPVQLPVPIRAPALHVFNQYVIRVPAQLRDSLLEYLRQHQVETEIYYRLPLHLQECFRPLGFAPGDLPVSERAAEETLALPIYPELTEEQIRAVVGRIQAFFRSKAR